MSHKNPDHVERTGGPGSSHQNRQHPEKSMATGKKGGGDNGHNGLRSITKSLGDKEYVRLRFGVGRPPGRMDAAAFVLKDFSAAERRELPLFVDRAADAVESLLKSGISATQNTFHAL